MTLEVNLENMAAPFVELSDSFIKPIELAVRTLGRINEEIWVLVGSMKDLVEMMRRKELSEMDGDQEAVKTGVQTEEELEVEKVNK
jgi:hypothetical protein